VSGARGWTPTLQYSPVNGVIVNWGVRGEPFGMCCMPQPDCPAPPVTAEGAPPCAPLPVVEPVPTYDWLRWAPEIMAGVENVPADMAASFARRAAIEFSRKARVLRRVVTLRLQPGVFRYPIDSFEGERPVGVLSVDSAGGPCRCDGADGVFIGRVGVDAARHEITVNPEPGACGCHMRAGSGPDWLLVHVWAAPTEDSCAHDAYLYEAWREDITFGARAMLMDDVHSFGAYKTNRGYASSRGDAFVVSRAQALRAEFDRRARRARVEAVLGNAVDAAPPPPAAFGVVRGFRR
jgi:hypothetical protein